MYLFIGDGHHERLRDEDDELLQFAIQQSLMDGGTENEQVVCLGLSCCKSVTFQWDYFYTNPLIIDLQQFFYVV